MKEWTVRVRDHLRAAQGWLKKAERSFDEEKTIRGELDLMLAQAELRRAQERKRDGQGCIRPTLYRHGTALLCAVLLGSVGMFCWTLLSEVNLTHPAATSPSVQTMSEKVTLSAQDTSKTSEIEVETVSTSKVEEASLRVSIPIAEAHSTENDAQTTSGVSISREEMQSLMQAAGRSLRGQ